MKTTIIQLTHGQHVAVPSFRFTNKIEIVTPCGYAISYGDCPEEAEARATKFGHEFLACFKHPSIITADYNGKAERLEAERKEWEEAQRINEGDIVECEGRKYIVKILGENFNDPVKFIPAN